MNQLRYVVQASALAALGGFTFLLIEKFLPKPQSVDEKAKETQFFCGTVNPPVPANLLPGKTLFYDNCASCHALDKTICGPDLRSAETRGPWVERKNLIAWVKNPSATIPKFEYTKQLVEAFNGLIMPAFPQLTDAQIEAILDYIKAAPSPYSPMPVAAN